MGGPEWVEVFPIENGDIPASYVSLLEGTCDIFVPATHQKHIL